MTASGSRRAAASGLAGLVAVLVAGVVAVVAFAAAPVAAAAGAPAAAGRTVSIRQVDASRFPQVRVGALVSGPPVDVRDVAIRENGRIVTGARVVPIAESETPLAVVLAVDTSGSMRAGGRLDQAKAAARAFVEQKPASTLVAVVAFSNEPRVVVNFTADPALLERAIAGLTASGETALWDAVSQASGLLADEAAAAGALPYLVVLSDGADTVSRTGADAALATVRASHAGAFAVAITGAGESDAAALRRLAESTGGAYAETADPRELGRLYSGIQAALENQYEITWASAATAGSPLEVSVAAGGSVATSTVAVGARSGPLQPPVVHAPAGPGPLRSRGGALVVALLVGLAVAAAGGLVVAALRKDGSPLDVALAPYTGGAPTPSGPPDGADRMLVPELVQRVVERTAQLAGGRSVLDRLDVRLEQADLKVRAQEAVLFYAVAVAAVSGVVLVAGGPLLGLAALFVAALAPLALLDQMAGRRRKAFARQLPDALQLLASSLRAGYSLVQAFEAVSEELDDPMGRELRRVVVEVRLGRDIEVALDETARRMASPDFDWVVIAIRIQREVGGNLAELLSSVSDTMVARERLRREVGALTAEGRLSAIIVGALPFVVALALSVVNPGYLHGLFASQVGRGMVLGAVLLTAAGFVWMKKTIEIDV